MRSSWSSKFFNQVLVALVTEGIIVCGGLVMLPFEPYTLEELGKNAELLGEYYEFRFVEEGTEAMNDNWLWLGTQLCTADWCREFDKSLDQEKEYCILVFVGEQPCQKNSVVEI